MQPASVASGSHAATEAALTTLRAGGNAVDAALAGFFASCVSEPLLTGPLGGGFAIAQVDGAAHCVDGFAYAPQELRGDYETIHVDFGATQQVFHAGWGSVAESRLLPALDALHQKVGRLDRAALVAPAMGIARQGTPLHPYMGYVIQILRPILDLTPEATALFPRELEPGGVAFRNPELADVLDAWARQPEPTFRALAEQCGTLTAPTPRVHTPMTVDVGRHTVHFCPPPSVAGGLVAFGLGLLAGSPCENREQMLRTIFAALATMDQARTAVDLSAIDANEMAAFVHPEHVRGWRDTFETYRRGEVPGPTETTIDLGSTTHVSVIDAEGNACAITTSNGEGCGHLLPGTGVMPNNFMGEEDLHPQGIGNTQAGTRLISMMAPTLVAKDGRVAYALGSGGSNRIRSALLQVMTRVLLRNESLYDAIKAPRLHVEGDNLFFEQTDTEGEAVPTQLQDSIATWARKSVPFEEPNLFFGGVHAAHPTEAVGDPRRGGVGRTRVVQ